MVEDKRITIEAPTSFSAEESRKITQARQDRLQGNNVQEVLATFEALLKAGDSADTYRSVWLTNQIVKTQFILGKFVEALALVDSTLAETLEKAESSDEAVTYMKYKFLYAKAKLEAKVRLLTASEETCNRLIKEVKDVLEPAEKPLEIKEEEKEEPKVQEITEEQDTVQAIETKTETKEEKAVVKPQKWWKFAIKAAYLKVIALARCMEFAKPKALMETFAQPALKAYLEEFVFTSQVETDALAEKTLQDHYYSFELRRAFAKLRKLSYFVPETETILKTILFDELHYYKVYDFTEFETENPVIKTEEDEAPAAASAQQDDENASDEPKIEVKQPEEPAKANEEKKEVTKDVKTEDVKKEDVKKEEVKKEEAVEVKTEDAVEGAKEEKKETVEEKKEEKPAEVEVVEKEAPDAEKLKEEIKEKVEKFEVDYSKIALTNSLALHSIVKTVSALAKIYIVRHEIEKSQAALGFIEKAIPAITGVEGNEANTFLLAKLYQQYSHLYLTLTNQHGAEKYDLEDRPLKFGEKSLDVTKALIPEKESNYVLAKALACVGKAYLVKGEREKAEEFFLQAQTKIQVAFGAETPIAVKYNQNLVEAYNLREETEERAKLLIDITQSNLDICEKIFGKGSIYNIRPMYTLYTAKLHERDSSASQKVLKDLASLEHDGEPVRQNQFQYKAILIDTMILMRQATQQSVMRVELQLSSVFERQLEYCESNKNHPFLEEVVSIFASYFESAGSYQNAFLMWSKFLRIQQNLFGKDREQMISTYKKMATLSTAIGEPTTGAKYFQKAAEILDEFKKTHKDEPKTKEEEQEDLEEQSALYFQQYLAAQQTGNYEDALKFVSLQTQVLLKLNNTKNTKVCSNIFLEGQFQMRTGRFNESLESITKAIEMLGEIKDQFGDDFEVVRAKFLLLLSNVNFIVGNYEDSRDAAEAAIESVDRVVTTEADIKKAMQNTRKDLINNKIRSTAKIDKTVKIADLRKEIREAERKIEESLKPQAIKPAVPTPTEGDDAGDESEDEEGEGFDSVKALTIAGMVTATTALGTYLFVNKSQH